MDAPDLTITNSILQIGGIDSHQIRIGRWGGESFAKRFATIIILPEIEFSGTMVIKNQE
jgi:hypothetical protein